MICSLSLLLDHFYSFIQPPSQPWAPSSAKIQRKCYCSEIPWVKPSPESPLKGWTRGFCMAPNTVVVTHSVPWAHIAHWTAACRERLCFVRSYGWAAAIQLPSAKWEASTPFSPIYLSRMSGPCVWKWWGSKALKQKSISLLTGPFCLRRDSYGRVGSRYNLSQLLVATNCFLPRLSNKFKQTPTISEPFM